MKTPIVLTAYNRPDYFKKVLESLSPQCWDREVYCFIDAPRFQQEIPAVQKCINLSKEIIPHSKNFIPKVNLGVAGIMKLSREMVFKKNEFLILIEDDSVLQPHYIQQIDRLIELFKDDERVAMINCFGEHHRSKKSHRYSYINYIDNLDSKTTLKDQKKNKDKLILMDHMWAYAMRRSSYQKILDIMEGFLALLPQEYRARPHLKILEYMSQFGIDPNKIVSSQDSCTSSALISRGMIKVSTFTNNFEYIGEVGEHSRPNNFREAGWCDQDVYTSYQDDFIWNDETFNEIRTHAINKYLK